MQGYVQSKLLLDDRHQDIDADSDPNLRPHSVLGGAVEALDAQVLLDPLEEQSTCHRHRYRAQMSVLARQTGCHERQDLAGLDHYSRCASQLACVCLDRIEAVKGDGLVADQSRVAIHRRRIQAPCIEVLLGAGDEEASHLIERIEPLEVQVTPIHDVEGTGLDKQQVQHIDVVHLAVGDVDEGGDRSPEIEQLCNFTAALWSETAPTGTSTGTDRWSCIEGIHGISQFYAEVLVDVERAGLDDQALSQLEVDAPVARLVASASVERATAAPMPMW